MKLTLPILVLTLIATFAQGYELHPHGYSIGLNDPEEKKGKQVEIKIGFADTSHSHDLKQIEEKEGFVVYECWAALNAEKEKIEACDVIIRHVFVPTKRAKDFEKKYSYVRPEIAGRNPFPGTTNILDIKETGNTLKGTLWLIDETWVLVTK